ncbi:hypothetical protein [Nocardiopsis metallicus]|uniref:Type II secretory pathway pseudopilin PulG n=1 Tax=Nocardiopsis metallicus TaxID=179819 RepID=A0A840WS07_9ACTN|nr:hypothetical protein [Nocardiopsis metallicus]MBB5494347.1 type II secretory pathway pseudopilin PulG [Nocardiopsis metallicus]
MKSVLMDPTAITGIAGIIGTLAAAILTPLIAERARRKSARQEQLRGRRMELYADLLRFTARIVENAENWSATPLVALEEVDLDELDRVGGQADALASEKVDGLLQDFMSRASTFHRALAEAQEYLRPLRADAGGPADDTTSIQQRVCLADMASELHRVHKTLRARIRYEMRD